MVRSIDNSQPVNNMKKRDITLPNERLVLVPQREMANIKNVMVLIGLVSVLIMYTSRMSRYETFIIVIYIK